MEKIKKKDYEQLKSLLITDLIDEDTPQYRLYNLSTELLSLNNRRKRKRNVSK